MTANVKVCGCRPHDGGAADTGAGVRKPPMEETAGCGARWRVRRCGDLAAVSASTTFAIWGLNRSRGRARRRAAWPWMGRWEACCPTMKGQKHIPRTDDG